MKNKLTKASIAALALLPTLAMATPYDSATAVTGLATSADTLFGVIAPITVSIVGFGILIALVRKVKRG